MDFARTVLLAALLTGCAAPTPQYRWQHASGVRDQEMLERDFAGCEAQALATHPLTPREQAVALLGACMRSKGWRLVDR